jgi:hypothetical protein
MRSLGGEAVARQRGQELAPEEGVLVEGAGGRR